ncbi:MULTISPECIES: ATP-binding cassette domain-containing protein [unclassified Streptomyces]|uniref:ATP-binding cassette domain-containing protein n=1 Tax=unclassified Streptomyces TaxID=2593676 RepID=UPI0007C8B0B2|nr:MULTISPECIES: ATP-binding cassette domain-containing protein [unclassified Streptomyces]
MIEVHELTKQYGRPGRGRLAVDRLGFGVKPGRVTGFLGPNGAGKSTTLRLILGLNEPTSGTATVGGRRFRDLPRGLRHVGALLDAQDVHGGRTAEAQLAALARGNGIPRRRVGEVLDEVGLAEVGRRRIGGYSLGMRQRLGIAAALLGDPPVLLFDEPVNGLDPEGVLWARGLFRRLAAEGRTVFVSSHLMGEMEHTADDLVVIGRGRLLAAESVADFAARGTRRSVTVRPADPAAAQGLAAALTAEGATVRTEPVRAEAAHPVRTEPVRTEPVRAEAVRSEAAGTLVVTGVDAARIGVLAFRRGVPLAELTPNASTLEEAFMELTADTVEYR